MSKRPQHTPIKLLLFQRGVAQVDLAMKTGISPSRLSMIVNGRTQASAEDLRKIAKAMRVPIKSLR